MKVFILLKIVVYFNVIIAISNYTLKDLNNPLLFIDQICSNRYIAFTNINNTIICNCSQNYVTIPNNTLYINNNMVQCSYKKKKRFVTLFYSIFVPFGLDYLYLGHYLIFVVILLISGFALISNCYRFTFTKSKYYLSDKSDWFYVGIGLLAILIWIINIFLMGFGLITDENGFETVSDLYMLFFGKNDQSDL